MPDDLHSVVPEPDAGSHKPVNPSHVPSNIWRYLRSAQKYSAYTFTAFACLHVASVAVLPAVNHEVAESAFMFARTIYQNSVGEAVLVFGSAAVHVLCGLALHTHRMYVRYRDYGRISFGANIYNVTGLVLVPILLAHITANRIAPLVALGDSSEISLDYITHMLHVDMFGGTSGLMAIVMAYLGHSFLGLNSYLRLRLKKRTIAKIWAVAVALAFVSVITLSKRPDAIGYVVSQFDLAHSLALKWLRPF